MEPDRLVDELCGLADRVGLEVRREPLEDTRGGLCVLRGRAFILLDSRLPADEQAEVLAAALNDAGRRGAAGDLDDLYILPEVRQFLETAAGRA